MAELWQCRSAERPLPAEYRTELDRHLAETFFCDPNDTELLIVLQPDEIPLLWRMEDQYPAPQVPERINRLETRNSHLSGDGSGRAWSHNRRTDWWKSDRTPRVFYLVAKH